MALARPRARVLDVGCGTGEDAVWLARQGFVVHGIDESRAMTEVARKKAEQFRSSATFECRSVQSLSTTSDRFDRPIQ